MTRRVADLLVETLQAAGVKTCYGIVGDTLNRIAHAIDKSDIDWVHMRHEEAGAFAAGAEAMTSVMVSGAVLLVVWAAAGRTALGWALIAAALTPTADALIVLTNGGKLSTVLGIHGLTAA